MFDTKKTKEFDLGTFGKILYFTGALRLKKEESEKFQGSYIRRIKMRVLHPFGFILLLISSTICFFLVGFEGVKENWKDDFCIF